MSILNSNEILTEHTPHRYGRPLDEIHDDMSGDVIEKAAGTICRKDNSIP
jgi:hypothetical protein